MAALDVHELEPLLRRALAGDGPALNDLFARLRKYMHHRVREELGAGPDGRIDRSVLVQSVCRRAFIHFPELEAPNVPRLLRWVATIVKNRVRDELRRLARQPVHLLGSGVLALVDLRPHGASAGRAELAAQIGRAHV